MTYNPEWEVGGSNGVTAQSSGVLTGGVISIGAGGAGVATTFSITSGTGQVVDNTVSPSTVTAVTWTAKTNVAVTNILTQLVTFVALDGSGNVVQSGTDWTPVQMREYIVIGVVVHSNQTTVNAVNQTQVVAYAAGAQVNDLMYGIGLFNVSGNAFTPNGANLKLNKSAGSIFRRGANYTTLSDNPHIITTGVLTQAPLRMQNRTGAGSASGTDVDVANYDLAGVTTAISPATRFTILRVFLFQSNLVAVQRGQATYLSLAEAKAAIQTETFVTNAILAANGLLRGFIVAQANASSLSDAAKVFFIEAGKFGGTSGVGGLSVSTLQNAYDNSSSPEILTDATRLALTMRRGSGADTDLVYEGQNGAGSTTFSVTGAGVVTGSNLSGTNTGDNAVNSLYSGLVSNATHSGDAVNSLYSGLVSNATHTGEVTGATALTIANDAVTYAKMQNVSAASRLLGRGSAGGAGDVEEITVGAGLSLSGTTLSASGGGGSDIVGAAAPISLVPVNNSTTHQTLATDSISVAAGDQIEIEVIGSFLNNSGGTVTPNVRFSLGSLNVDVADGATSAASATNRSLWVMTGRWAVFSTSSVIFGGETRHGTAAAANTAMSTALATNRSIWQTSASDLTGTVTCAVGFRSSTNTATQSFTVHSWRIRKTGAV